MIMKNHAKALVLAATLVGLAVLAACAGAEAPAKPAAPFGLPTEAGLTGVRSLAGYSVPCYVAQGGANIVAASGCTVSVESGGTINVESGGTLSMDGGATVTGVISNDMNGGSLFLDPNQSTILRAQTNGLATFTLPATGTLQVTTGNLRVGNGSNGVTLTGEDAYVEGTFENDGGANLAGGQTLAGAMVTTAASPVAATTGALVSTGWLQPLTATGTVTPTITPGAAGTTTCFYMTSSATAVFVDTGNVVLAGNFSMGQYDQLCGVSDGTRWIERSRANN